MAWWLDPLDMGKKKKQKRSQRVLSMRQDSAFYQDWCLLGNRQEESKLSSALVPPSNHWAGTSRCETWLGIYFVNTSLTRNSPNCSLSFMCTELNDIFCHHLQLDPETEFCPGKCKKWYMSLPYMFLKLSIGSSSPSLLPHQPAGYTEDKDPRVKDPLKWNMSETSSYCMESHPRDAQFYCNMSK